ncbi:hypothetical protein B0H16DRAFT_1722100 [Mycena metata]|uniref:HNH nuclease domain-containing protein n=1 Tax=Mycena metata TaxID=1033252 RepID=A0AAD7J3H2_9AGAR|nr:hypothetical protein B0H16DRAFT_1722100 [Mycena metata]
MSARVMHYEPTPLPPYTFKTENDRSAYEICLWLQTFSAWGTFADDLNDLGETLMCKTSVTVAARTLGYALIYSPTTKGRDAVAREINGCGKNAEHLAGLAHLYIYGLIRVFRNPKGPTPSVSPVLSPRLSVEVAVNQHRDKMVEDGKTPHSLREQVIHRDRHRCVFTNRADSHNPTHDDVKDLDSAYAEKIEVAHIISQSLTNGISGLSEDAQKKLDWASSAFAILDRFAGIEVKALLGTLYLHSPLNTMMASGTPHDHFDHLYIFFEPFTNENGDIVDNKYRLVQCMKTPYGPLSETVTFTARLLGNKRVDPPSPKLLALHAACVRIAHLSGAADVLEKFDKSSEDHYPVLSKGFKDMSYNPKALEYFQHALHKASMQLTPARSLGLNPVTEFNVNASYAH